MKYRRRNYQDSYLMSIHPKYAELIYAGKKTIELRSRFNPRLIHSIVYIYETSPVRQITGQCTIQIGDYVSAADINSDLLAKICISEKELKDYLGNSEGRLLHLSDVCKYKDSIDISAVNVGRPPQSWKYFDSNRINFVRI